MAKYLIVILTALHLSVLGLGSARAQIPADLSARGSVGDLSATGMSANLSAQNSTGASEPSIGSRSSAPNRNVSPSRFTSLTSRASYHSGYDEMMQETPTPSSQARTTPGSLRLAGVHPSVTSTRSSRSTISTQVAGSAPGSFGSSSPALQTPVYSFLMSNKEHPSRSGPSQSGLSREGNRMKGLRGPPMRSLDGVGSSKGESYH